MPRITCNITGHSYYATNDQIESKAKAVELSVEEFLTVYICRKASTLLQKGHSIQDIRNLVDCSEEVPDITSDQIEKITSLHMQSNVRRVLSNFTTISSLAIDDTDPAVSSYINFLKNN